MGSCCSRNQQHERANDEQPMINVENISKSQNLINSSQPAPPLLSGPDYLAFKNVVDFSSGDQLEQNVLDAILNSSTSDSDLEEEDQDEA